MTADTASVLAGTERPVRAQQVTHAPLHAQVKSPGGLWTEELALLDKAGDLLRVGYPAPGVGAREIGERSLAAPRNGVGSVQRESAIPAERRRASQLPRKPLRESSFGDASDKPGLCVCIRLPRSEGRCAVQGRKFAFELLVLSGYLVMQT